jgi:uncharacterized BrkB/YihY/UPF0761 family membrane protein
MPASAAPPSRRIPTPASPRIPPPLPRTAPTPQRLGRTVERLVRGLYVHKTGDVAPSMAFHFFLSLIPLLVLAGLVIGHIARQRGVDALLGPAIETAPDAVEQLVRDELQRMAGTSGSSIAPLSVAGFLWIAATGTHGLMDAFELASGAPRRPWWKKRAIALVWVAGMLAVLAAITYGIVGVDAAVQRASAPAASTSSSVAPSATTSASSGRSSSARRAAAGGKPGDQTASARSNDPNARPSDRDAADAGLVRRARHKLAPLLQEPWERIAVALVLVMTALGALAGFYRSAVEHPHGVERRAMPGAVVALAGWLLVSWGFGVYVSTFGRYTLFYGSVATVAVLLIWFYLTSWTLLVGAELNAQLEGLRDAPTGR